jgi:two-component system, NarL family, response regulator DegU
VKPIRVLVVDDQHLFAESLKFVLEGEGKGRIEVTGIGENGRDAVALAEKHRPDVILMDIRMPVMDGVEATAEIHKKHPGIKIMILTTFDDDELAINALSNGASGYVLKDVDPPDLILSIEAVFKGGFYITRSVGFRLFDSMKPGADGADKQKEAVVLDLIRTSPSLTRREAEILYLAAKGQANKTIADDLNISEKTVKNHIASIYEKLNIHNRLQLINHVLSLQQHTAQ